MSYWDRAVFWFDFWCCSWSPTLWTRHRMRGISVPWFPYWLAWKGPTVDVNMRVINQFVPFTLCVLSLLPIDSIYCADYVYPRQVTLWVCSVVVSAHDINSVSLYSTDLKFHYQRSILWFYVPIPTYQYWTSQSCAGTSCPSLPSLHSPFLSPHITAAWPDWPNGLVSISLFTSTSSYSPFVIMFAAVCLHSAVIPRVPFWHVIAAVWGVAFVNGSPICFTLSVNWSQ